MSTKEKNTSKKLGKSGFSTIMYVVSAVVAVVGVALLVNNIILFKSTVSEYVTQGYPAGTVIKELIPSMLSGIFEPVGIYGGIAFLLLGVGMVNKKVSKCLILLKKVEVSNDTIAENIVEQENCDLEDLKFTEDIETVK